MANDPDLEKLKIALDHTWSWYELHATQRMQVVNFFLVSAAFLTAAYVTALKDGRPLTAAYIAAAGFIATMVFWGLEFRTRKLLGFSRDALIGLQAQLGSSGGRTELNLAQQAENSGARLKSYKVVINTLALTSSILFVGAIVNALR